MRKPLFQAFFSTLVPERAFSFCIKISRNIDPACGSGAFPIGILQRTSQILEIIDPNAQKWLEKQLASVDVSLREHLIQKQSNQLYSYIRKLGIISKNIYGVDIQPIATEISRLRCFLTLMVDEIVNDDNSNRGILPLPNLDFKFVTANTLIPLLGSDHMQINIFEESKESSIDEKRKALLLISSKYFSTYSKVKKSELKNEFYQIRESIVVNDYFDQENNKQYKSNLK